jgi:hypothetical protein
LRPKRSLPSSRARWRNTCGGQMLNFPSGKIVFWRDFSPPPVAEESEKSGGGNRRGCGLRRRRQRWAFGGGAEG